MESGKTRAVAERKDEQEKYSELSRHTHTGSSSSPLRERSWSRDKEDGGGSETDGRRGGEKEEKKKKKQQEG